MTDPNKVTAAIDDSYVVVNSTGTLFVGTDATNLFRAITLASAIDLYMKTGLVPTRGVTGPKMLALAKEYTNVVYKRGQYAQALAELRRWIAVMKLAMPATVDGVQV
jgi:hypothetical protein